MARKASRPGCFPVFSNTKEWETYEKDQPPGQGDRVYTVCRLRFFHDVGIYPAGRGCAYGGKGLLPQHCGPGHGGRSAGGEAGAAEAGKGQLAVHHRPGCVWHHRAAAELLRRGPSGAGGCQYAQQALALFCHHLLCAPAAGKANRRTDRRCADGSAGQRTHHQAGL